MFLTITAKGWTAETKNFILWELLSLIVIEPNIITPGQELCVYIAPPPDAKFYQTNPETKSFGLKED